MTRIIKKGKVIIKDDIVEKEEKDIKEITKYLESRDFYDFIPLIEHKNNHSYYEYREDIAIDNNQKLIDLIDTISKLHNKTSFYKEVNLNTNKNIYTKTKGHIKYLKKEYLSHLEDIEGITYPTPSNQLFMYNYSKVISCLDFIDNELDKWYKLVENNTQERVAMIHGNLELDHLIRNDTNYLISLSKAHIETPIKDIIDLYHKEWNKTDFKEALETYIKQVSLTKEEQKLLFIYLSIPIEYKETEDELINTSNMNKFIEYIYKTEELIRPYYSE